MKSGDLREANCVTKGASGVNGSCRGGGHKDEKERIGPAEIGVGENTARESAAEGSHGTISKRDRES